MEMIADENGMAPQMLFGGMPGFGGPRGASSFGDYVTTQRKSSPSPNAEADVQRDLTRCSNG